MRKQVKPEHERCATDIRDEKPGFNIFAYLSSKRPRLRKEIDARNRLRMAQRKDDR